MQKRTKADETHTQYFSFKHNGFSNAVLYLACLKFEHLKAAGQKSLDIVQIEIFVITYLF